MDFDCDAVRDASLQAKQIILDFRLFVAIVFLTILNIIYDIVSRTLNTYPTYKYHTTTSQELFSVSCVKLIAGPIIAISGYSILIFNGITGCNANEIFVYWTGAIVLLVVDVHEWVRRWPLPLGVMMHHLMVFSFAMLFCDFEFLRTNNNDNASSVLIGWNPVLLMSNIAMTWITDFFHVIARIGTNLPIIEKARRIFLILSVVRVVTVGQFFYDAALYAMDGNWFAVSILIFFGIAYAYQSVYVAIRFVLNFNCKSYYENHQAKWLSEEEEEEEEKKEDNNIEETDKLEEEEEGDDEENIFKQQKITEQALEQV